MYVCMYVCMYICICICIYMYVCMYVCINIYGREGVSGEYMPARLKNFGIR